MKALLLTDVSKFEYTDVPTPEPKTGEVQIIIKACAICNSDVHGYDGTSGRRLPGLIIGHEASGVISKVGERVTRFKVGDPVVFNPVKYCGTCYYCRHGLENVCDNGCCHGIKTETQHLDGAMAEYLCVPEYICYKMPDGLSFERAAMIEPLGVMLHVVKGVDIKVNDTVVMFGSGVMGLMGIKVLKATGAGKIIAVEVDEFKKEMARKNGVDYVVDGREDVPARIKELTNGLGADYAFDTAGVKTTIANAFHSLKKGGTLVQIGNISPTVEVPLQTLVNNEIHWIGRYGTFDEFEAALSLMGSGKVNVDDCLSHVVPLKDGQEWFDRLHAQEPGLLKVVLVP